MGISPSGSWLEGATWTPVEITYNCVSRRAHVLGRGPSDLLRTLDEECWLTKQFVIELQVISTGVTGRGKSRIPAPSTRIRPPIGVYGGFPVVGRGWRVLSGPRWKLLATVFPGARMCCAEVPVTCYAR